MVAKAEPEKSSVPPSHKAPQTRDSKVLGVAFAADAQSHPDASIRALDIDEAVSLEGRERDRWVYLSRAALPRVRVRVWKTMSSGVTRTSAPSGVERGRGRLRMVPGCGRVARGFPGLGADAPTTTPKGRKAGNDAACGSCRRWGSNPHVPEDTGF
jgi:hypothetical protein